MRIPCSGDGVPRIHHRKRGNQSRSHQNLSNMGMGQTNKSKGNPKVHGILQLLQKVHRRIKPQSKTLIPVNKEGPEMGMGKKGRRSVRRNQNPPHFSTNPDTLWSKKNQSRSKRTLQTTWPQESYHNLEKTACYTLLHIDRKPWRRPNATTTYTTRNC